MMRAPVEFATRSKEHEIHSPKSNSKVVERRGGFEPAWHHSLLRALFFVQCEGGMERKRQRTSRKRETQRPVCTRRNLGKESPAERLIAPSRSRLTARLQLLPRRPPTAPSQSRLTARLRLLPRRPLTAPSRSRLTARLQLLQRRPLTAPSRSRLTARLRLLPRKPLTAPSRSPATL